MIGWAIYWFLSRTTPSKRAGYRKAPRSLKRRGLGLDQTGRDRGTSVLRSGAKLQIESSSQALRAALYEPCDNEEAPHGGGTGASLSPVWDM